MSIYSKQAPSWQDDADDRSILALMQDLSDEHHSPNLTYQYQASQDVRFYVGDQKVWRDHYGQDMGADQFNLNFNLLHRYVEWPAGYQRQNRKTINVIPIEGSDQKTADQFTKLIMQIGNRENLDETLSASFHSACITGINFIRPYIDYSRDPLSGDLMFDSVAYNAMLFDSYFKKLDGSDCSFMWQRSYVDHEQIDLLLPSYKDRLKDIGINRRRGVRQSMSYDMKFKFMPESIFYQKSGKGIIYDEFFNRSTRPGVFIYDPVTLKQLEWVGSREKLREYIYNFPRIKVIEQDVTTVKQANVVNGHVIYNGGNTLGIDEFPYVPIVSYYTPESNSLDYRLQGIIRGLRDAQYLYNRTTTNILKTIESQPNSGWIAKAGSVVNPTSLFKSGSGQVIFRKKGSLPDDVVKIPPGSIQPGSFEIQSELKKLPGEISGVPEELMGASQDDVSGFRAMLRQGAGLILLRRLFDQLDTSMKVLGRLCVKIIQNNYTPGKIERIINEQPTDEFRDRDFGNYDIAIEEGFNTSTQRQLAFAQALQLKEVMGDEFPSSQVIKKATIQDKDEILEEMQQIQQQKQQADQQVAQSAAQEQQATLNMAEAQAEYQKAGAQLRLSEIQENRADTILRVAQSEKDTEQALLNKIKAYKELEGIDLAHLKEIVQIAQSIENQKPSALIPQTVEE